jgi:membrane fusion protein (multidrug efflux system)
MKNNLILSGIVCMLCFWGCHSEENHKETAEASFAVTNPLLKDTLINKEYVGQIRSIQHIELRSLDEGYLQKIYVDEGQSVQKGQLLFKLLSTVYEAEVKIAEAEAEYARIEYQNTKLLADKNIVSPNELAMLKALYDKAKANLSLAKAEYDFTEIRAPFNGIIGSFEDVREGSLLEEGELLTTLSDNSKMWVYFNVPEAEYLNYTYNSSINKLPKVALQLANDRIYEEAGVIETIEAEFNNETGNIAFRATFPNLNKILRHGQTGNIILPNQVQNALLIPQKATFEILDKKNVFVVDQKGVIQTREIEIEGELDHVFVIKSGLKPEDIILLEGLRKVKNGEKITGKMVSPDSVFSHLELFSE